MKEFLSRVKEHVPIRLIKYTAVLLSLFQLYTAAFGIFRSPMAHRAGHLGFVLVIYYLMESLEAKSQITKAINWLFSILSAITAIYLIVCDKRLIEIISLGEPTLLDNIITVLIIILVLEAIRRTQFAIFICCVLGLLYMPFGMYFPGILKHAGISWGRTIYFIGASGEGIYGDMLNVSSSFLFGFILLGAFLVKTGITRFFIEAASILFGRFTGGTAKMALFSSGLVGTVMGSGLANVATTGVFTIPMMKKSGLPATLAGAVETVAADGGQILPPVMGTAAFLMAEFTGIPYSTIALSAVVPAVLYYGGAFFAIHLFCKKNKISGLKKEEIPSKIDVLKKIYYLLPLVALMFAIFYFRVSPTRAALVGIAASIAVTFFRIKTRLTLRGFLDSLELGAKNAIEIVILCAGIGIFVGSLTTTGLAMRFSEIMMALSGGNHLIMLIVAMITSIALGTGLPTPAAYIVSAAFIAPSLVNAGMSLLAVHLFLVHFAIKASISPPVAVSAVVAAGIAETTDWNKTCWDAIKLCASSFFIPFMFVFGEGLLLVGSWNVVLMAVITASIGVFCIAVSVEGYLFNDINMVGRVILFAAGLLLSYQGMISDLLGIAFAGLVMAINFAQFLKTKNVALKVNS
ncbi:TRAP transporter permease [Candidatus Formimonas warabiya]|uniref:TRAP C4-dicarboxylate transport system permease DctM subunit domain-containing protein n=1 Tax=Formimonas warabiya TaxID=1761012 RepID=A0A3G1KZ64_FORW1|nr:TRAP transporter fused permease subunit [Candidatus Formimonas warabiya]ATW27677.1 hypothetical protein DCMF_25590 [Candidatus Formimonas warabiya]